MSNEKVASARSPLSYIAGLLALGLLGLSGGAIAQAPDDAIDTPTDAPANAPAPRPPNPLESTEPDPLLYIPPLERERTPFERGRLRRNADRLSAEAQGEYDAGNIDRAFEIWYRSLRLRRALGLAEEIPALGEFGALAWETGGRKLDIQFIGDRLIAAAEEIPAEPERPLLLSLATAYEQLRLSERAVALYERLLPGTPVAEREARLLKIGQLHQAYFNYPEAIATYEQLLERSSAPTAATLYLRELINLYALAGRPEQGLAAKESLLAQYTNDPEAAAEVPALLVEIGNDYTALDRVDAASISYREAYQRAWALRQFATASDALSRLGALYERSDRPEPAIRVYGALTQVQQRSRDFLGSIQTYDRLGELHLAQDDPTQALAAFESALDLAEALNYEPARFMEKVERARDRLVQ